MNLTFFGAAGEVGRSCILLESNDTKIIMDAGVKLGENDEYPLIHDDELKDIDGIITSHAHLDHTGYLAHIFSTNYKGHVYTTKPTFALTSVLISDYKRISNPENITDAGLEKLQKQQKIVDYHKEFQIKNLKIRLLPAGHILGSAMIEVYDGKNRLLYTGDINLRKTKLLDPPQAQNLRNNVLITESTYAGDKDSFQTEKDILEQMVKSMNETIKAGGKVIIPSFAVGRAQEVLLQLDDYIKSGRLEKVPLYMDGMINKAMRIHRHNVIFCRDELQKRILMNEDDPFKSVNFKPITTKGERQNAMKEQESSIIVTTSGMITGGPIMKYLENIGLDSKNKLILVGYQAAGTTGRLIAEGAKKIKIKEKDVDIHMKVEQYHLSAHADRQQLMHFVHGMKTLQSIFIVHGEKDKGEQFKNALSKDYAAYTPELGSTHKL